VFSDTLEFSENNWGYCKDSDRRFYTEIVNGIKPAGTLASRQCDDVGETQLCNKDPPPRLPKGSFDIGNGYYHVETGKIYSYEHQELRTPDEAETTWIISKCRGVE
jgi:hypothetical protein